MEKLKVGDVIYLEDSYNNGIKFYKLAKIERTTKTLAISSTGDKFKIEGCYRSIFSGNEKVLYFSPHPVKSFEYWHILSEEKHKEIRNYRIFRNKISWFDNAKFTDNQKALIHDLINKKDDTQN